MVIARFIATPVVISMFLSMHVYALPSGTSPSELEQWAGASDQAVQERKTRVKASDLSDIYYKTRTVQRRVYYRTPDGGRLVGFMLPNGKVAPAYSDAYRKEGPGCLASDGEVYPAEWEENQLICDIPQVGMVNIADDSFTVDIAQAIAERQQIKKAGKYSNSDDVSNVNRDVPQQAETKTDLPSHDGSGSDKQAHQPKYTQSSSVTQAKRTSSPKAYQSSTGKPMTMTPVTVSTMPSTTFTMGQGKKLYGVPFGQWVKVRLNREVTNADNGDIELILAETLPGKKRDVEVGTILFANKSFNSATKRMDLTVSKGIQPNDEKLNLKAVVYDINKVSGLSGILERDRAREVKSAMGRSALQVVDTVVGQTTDASIAGQATGNVANDMLRHEERYLPRAPDALIRVYPQEAYIRIVESF